MKKTILSLLIALFVTSGVFAQQRQRATPTEKAEKRTETLVKELGLSDDQKAKVYEINLKYAQPKESQNGEMDREKRKEAFKKDQEAQSAEIKVILTSEQQKKFEEFQKEARNKVRTSRRNK